MHWLPRSLLAMMGLLSVGDDEKAIIEPRGERARCGVPRRHPGSTRNLQHACAGAVPNAVTASTRGKQTGRDGACPGAAEGLSAIGVQARTIGSAA
jgi:hypothetical protein